MHKHTQQKLKFCLLSVLNCHTVNMHTAASYTKNTTNPFHFTVFPLATRYDSDSMLWRAKRTMRNIPQLEETPRPSCFRFDVLPILESFISISLRGKQNELTEKAINTWFTHWKLSYRMVAASVNTINYQRYSIRRWVIAWTSHMVPWTTSWIPISEFIVDTEWQTALSVFHYRWMPCLYCVLKEETTACVKIRA